MAAERTVYVHGVVADKTRTRKHTSQYRQLRDGISAELQRGGSSPLPSITDSVTIEWGWKTEVAGTTATLAVAQRNIHQRVQRATPTDRTRFGDLLFAPAVQPVRDLLMLGWADMAYYRPRQQPP